MPNLVGTGLNQVPINGMLGGLAYQDPEHASIKNLDLKNLSQINSEIADTAVDVFVYDTRKDSDGGAWRKRTQNTSWYNETLGTATRGTRREFPAVAVLVLESGGSTEGVDIDYTIYDGDDPDMPMWMQYRFKIGAGSNTAISALNGIITFCATDNGILISDFVKDRMTIHNHYHRHGYRFISPSRLGRSSVALYVEASTTGYSIVSQNCNDVAMTVLPNAPVDSATGLPVPTIAVATNLGVSVIKDDGNVVDYQGFSPIKKVAIDRQYVYVYARSEPNDYIFKTTFLSSDATYNVDITAGSGGFYVNSIGSPVSPLLKNMNATGTVVAKDHTYIRSGNDGIEIFDGNVTTVDADTAVIPIAYIASDYNTGYMVGDIKGAFLSDTDDTDLDGGNKVTNGDAWSGAQSSTSSTPPTGWTGGNSAQWFTSTGGDGSYIRLVNAGSAQGGPNSYMYQSITTVAGRKYKISVTQYHHATISVFFRAGTSVGSSNLVQNNWVSSSGATPRYEHNTFTASGTTTYITLGIVSGTNNYSVGWDDVVVTEVDEDRSVNATGLHSFGTITKTPVATGAELVAYSGFSASNYLERNTNVVNFGTSGKISFTGWVKQSSTSEYSYITSVTSPTLSAPVGMALMTSTGNFYVYEGTTVRQSSTSISDGNWHHCVGIIDGTTVRGYVDGREVLNTTGTAPNLSSIDEFAVGHFATSGRAYPFLGSLALVRISASIPSPEQIKKMYEDEKHLFQENAKCTLYGSSDAVTALAFDDTTNLLHVGTSAGRSEFQGLCRINNTTDAVTTAISASNGLVAEQ